MINNGEPHPLHNLNLNKTEYVLSDFININKKLKRKPYPMPKINDMLLKLESFQYDTSLDLNTGYYNIWLRVYLGENIVTNVYQWKLLILKKVSNRTWMIYIMDSDLSVRT